MEIIIPQDVEHIITELEAAGFEAYAVGGCVRDAILGRTPNDWDITTSAKPEEMKAIFRRTVDTGIEHGTVTVLLGPNSYEVTTYRIDGEYEDGRHPKEVTFTSDLVEDLKRRDFTINAMAYHPKRGLVDEFDGIGDLNNHIIRCVGDAKERFNEDALRMLRALRFAAQLDFEIEKSTMDAVRELGSNIQMVSAERIRVELIKLICSDHPEKMRDLHECGLCQYFLPEFDEMMECEQNTVHHCYSVGMHTIVAMENIEPIPRLRLAMLLHDVAKPVCKTTDENGVDHFYSHPKRGEKMAKDILTRLKMDNKTIDFVATMVRYHDFRPTLNAKSIRHAAYKMGPDAFPEIFKVKRADMMAQSLYRREEKLREVEVFAELYQKIIDEQNALSIKELKIDGKVLIEMGVKPGPKMGEILSTLLNEVLDEPSRNNKEYLQNRVKEICEL